MFESGNPEQWGNVHPPAEVIQKDIKEQKSYVYETDEILAVFWFDITNDPTYTHINGAWLDDKPYGVVHRIARLNSDKAKGSGKICLEWCFNQIQNIRIDTHKDNKPMITLLEKLGYKYCGIIKIENGDDRLAYQKSGE